MSNLYYVQVKDEVQEISKDRMRNIGDYINIFDTTYLLYTNKNSKEIYESIFIDDESSVFIIQCNINDYYGRANKRVWEWLREKERL
nr:hypothetical protein [uncultured Acinetobacter sp.]